MTRPRNYEWWIDSIQDCLGQVARQHDAINDAGGACRHVCDETYVDLDHFVRVVTDSGVCDVPREVWSRILDLTQADDLETSASEMLASQCLASDYFRCRDRWVYKRSRGQAAEDVGSAQGRMGDREPQPKAALRAFSVLFWIVALVYLPLMGLMAWSFFAAEPDPR